MFSYKDLLYFSEVASCSSLTRASERIGISQPSLSVGIKRLEEAVGAPLFVRHKHGVTLTKAGDNLLKHTMQLMQMWQTITEKSRNANDTIEGRFTLGCHPTVANYYLHQFLPSLLMRHQKLNLKIVYDLSRNITEAVISMRIDLGIVVNPVKHPDLVIIKLRDDKVSFWHCLSKKALASKEKTLIYDPELLQSHDLVRRYKRKGETFSRFIESRDLEFIAFMVSQGVGIGVLPESVAKSMTDYPLKRISNSPIFDDEICVIFRNENRFVKSIALLVEAIKKTKSI